MVKVNGFIWFYLDATAERLKIVRDMESGIISRATRIGEGGAQLLNVANDKEIEKMTEEVENIIAILQIGVLPRLKGVTHYD